jgi:hypothetical protein
MGAATRSPAVCASVVFLGLVTWATVALAAPRPVTRAQAASVAREINLRAGDLHLTTVGGVSVNSTGTDAVVRCGRPSPARGAWAAAHSPALTSGSASPLIASGTLILPTAAAVATDLRAVPTSSAQRCIAAALRSELESSTPSVKANVTVSRIPSAFDGGTGGYGIRLLARLRAASGNAVETSLYIDVFLTGYGQAIVQLSLTFDHPPSHQVERTLAALLLSRAHTALG